MIAKILKHFVKNTNGEWMIQGITPKSLRDKLLGLQKEIEYETEKPMVQHIDK